MNNNDLSYVGKRIKETREKNSLTQQELADKITGMTVQMVCGYEKGDTIPSLKNLIKISKGLNISLDYLCFGVEEQKKDKKKIEFYSDLVDSIVAFHKMEGVYLYDATEEFQQMCYVIRFDKYDDRKFISDIKAICDTRNKIDEDLFDVVVESVKKRYENKLLVFECDDEDYN